MITIKKEHVLGVLIVASLMITIASIMMPTKAYARTEPGDPHKQYQAVWCEENGKKWHCNTCETGTATCNANSCTDCKPASE